RRVVDHAVHAAVHDAERVAGELGGRPRRLRPALAVALEGDAELAEQRHAAVAQRSVHVAHRARLPGTTGSLRAVPTAVVVDAIRTPLGRRNGQLATWHPVDLLAHVLTTLTVRSDLDPALIDDVITGCVSQVGEQALNVSRNALLAAGFPDSVPGTTVDRQCGSSQQALHFAAQGVIAGAYAVAIGAGGWSMGRGREGAGVVGGGAR